MKKIKTKETEPEEKKKRLENYKSFINRGGPSAPGSKEIPDGEENCLKNLAFVFTGKIIFGCQSIIDESLLIEGVLESLERDDGKALIEKYGGRVTTAISGKTNYVVAGRDTSEAKLSKAKEMKIEVISEDDLLEMIRTRPGESSTSKATAGKAKRTPSANAQKPKDEPEPTISSRPKRTSSTSTKKPADEPEPTVSPKPKRTPSTTTKKPADEPKAKPTSSTTTKKSTNGSDPSVRSKPVSDDSNLLCKYLSDQERKKNR